MESVVTTADALADTSAPGAKGLKAGALGYMSNVVIAVASTAPAYSLATTLGFVVAVAGVGTHAPAVLIVSFIPILFISFGYRYLNLADPDAGTTFAWVTRAMGPVMGWINGWAIVLADVIVMASLADIASTYTFELVGWHSAQTTAGITIGSVVWIALMTWICYRGIELSARLQMLLLSLECVTLGIFSVVALVDVYSSGAPTGALHVSADWFNPFSLKIGSLVDGVLLGIFIYWGWDSGVAVNEESANSHEGPGRAAVLSTVLLVLIYVLVTTAAQADGGTKFLINNSNDVLSAMGTRVFGSGVLQKLLLFSVLTSASASTQTTILPTARTTISMAHWRALPRAFGRVHPRFQTPSVSTLAMGGISIVWTVALLTLDTSGSVLGDSITGLGFAICFYYGFTGLACLVYYRREVVKSARRLIFVGLVPLLGAAGMFYIFGKAASDYSKAGANYSAPLAGIQVPIVIGIGGLLLGLVFMVLQYASMPAYFRRRWFETAKPEVLDEHFASGHLL